jgi:hypothetical protein
LAISHGELDGIALVAPAGVLWELEEQHCGLLGEGSRMFPLCSDAATVTSRLLATR